jgi:hypothetical protein
LSNEQFGAALIAFIVANAASLWAFTRWGIGRAIAYTHLERDVKELQEAKKVSDQRHEKILKDMIGLSIKIERVEREANRPKP